MRTRFYNPNLKRFINADIIDGSIDDSTSLNLYTYVNGNPISFVDPFGMDRSDGQVSSNSSLDISDISELIRKYIADPFMLINYNLMESVLKLNFPIIDTLDKKSAWKEYLKNQENDIIGYSPDDLRNDQNESDGPLSNLMYGTNSLKANGCEIIAVYNALLLMGYTDVSMAKLIYEHQLTDSDVLFGIFGTSPSKTSEILDLYNIEYESVDSVSSMNKSGIYIMSYWNKNTITEGLHTIAVNYTGNDYILYNDAYTVRSDNSRGWTWSSHSIKFDELNTYMYMYGYYLERGVYNVLEQK